MALSQTILPAIGLGKKFPPPKQQKPSYIPLTLDKATFIGFAVPQKFSSLGGRQAIAVHEFPGGTRTLQTFGAFPETITFSGIHTGTNAMDSQQKVDRLRAVGKVVKLQWGRYAWMGIVKDYRAEPGHQFYIPYRLTFEPLQDISGIPTVSKNTTSLEQQLNKNQAALKKQTGPLAALGLPSSLQLPSAGLLGDVVAGLAVGGGIVANIPKPQAATIQFDAASVQATAKPIVAAKDATQSSPAIDASNNAGVTSQIMAAPSTPIATVKAINPNLFGLAQQYYGDCSQWQIIGNANKIMDPQPMGSFTLVIPQQAPGPANSMQ